MKRRTKDQGNSSKVLKMPADLRARALIELVIGTALEDDEVTAIFNHLIDLNPREIDSSRSLPAEWPEGP